MGTLEPIEPFNQSPKQLPKITEVKKLRP